MEERAPNHGSNQGDRSEFVVRRFSPVRIEGLLLKRLLDITTGSPGTDRLSESSGTPSAGFAAGNTRGVRREAA